MAVEVELDHVVLFIGHRSQFNLETLERFGLEPGESVVFLEEGLASARYFFSNAYLEISWRHYEEGAREGANRRTGLWRRSATWNENASQFGVFVRPVGGQPQEPPFETWAYQRAIRPRPPMVDVGINSIVFSEPFIAHVSGDTRPASAGDSPLQAIMRTNGLFTMTRIKITSPFATKTSRPMQDLLAASAWLSYGVDNQQHLEIGFNDEPSGESFNFEPLLPLSFRW